MQNGTMRSSPPSITPIAVIGLLVALLSLGGCFLLRSKPDPRAQQLMSQLQVGLTPDEVQGRLGPPQRHAQNLFDKKKEYWVYEFADGQKKKKKKWFWSRSTEPEDPEKPPASEVQLLFERGKLAGWDHVPRR